KSCRSARCGSTSSSYPTSAPVLPIISARQAKTERARNGAGALSRPFLHGGGKPPASNYIELTDRLDTPTSPLRRLGRRRDANGYFGGIRSAAGGRNRSVYTVAGSGLTGS